MSPTAPIQSDLLVTCEEGLRVIELDLHRDRRWERFVNSHPNAMIYHHPAWFQALEREYGQKCVSLACVNAAGDIRAILPLLYTRGLPLFHGGLQAGCRLSSLPRTPLAGPLALEPRSADMVLQEAKRLVEGNPDLRLELKVHVPLPEDGPAWLTKVLWRDSYLLRLPSAPDQIRFGSGTHHRRLKWAVNKAIKSGLTCREAQNVDDLQGWYQLYLQRMRQNVVPARSYRFFAALWELMRPKGLMRLLVVDRTESGRRVLVAGSVFFTFRDTVSYAFNGSRAQDMWLCPNDLLHWQHIHQCCREGFRWYDFGEVPEDHPELALFKSKWGAEPTRLHRYYYPPPPPHKDAGTHRPLRNLANLVWRHLPLSATAYLSDHAYSYL